MKTPRRGRTALAGLMVIASSTVLTVLTPSAAHAAGGDCYENPNFFLDPAFTDSVGNKLRRVRIKCPLGPTEDSGNLTVGIVEMYVTPNHVTYVSVCDTWPDGIGPRLHMTFANGTKKEFADLGGHGDGCRTHQIGVDDSPAEYKKAAADDRNVSSWRASWDGLYSSNLVYPLRSQ